MKKIKKLIAIILSLLLAFSTQTFSIMVHAVGTGTEDNPYQISTAEELQNINNNVTAHYILTADIDLQGVDFTPIGNVDSGAFSGSFDGNGYTISNLYVYSGKYAGLFGCNEGTVKNVTLSDVYVCGTRYVGGVVGQNAATGKVVDCKVLSGKIETEGGLNAINIGGICGINDGLLEGEFYNAADITAVNLDVAAYAGGIIGYSSTSENWTAENIGDVSSNSYAGGLIGRVGGDATISDCYNTGNISGGHAGGLISIVGESATISDSYNAGNISGEYAGGLVSIVGESATISNSYNTGNISGVYNPGGLIGRANGDATVSNSYNTGNILGTYTSGGIIGAVYYDATVSNSYNTGNVSTRDSLSNAGGFIGFVDSDATILNSYNTGNILAGYSCSSLIASVDGNATILNVYSLESSYYCCSSNRRFRYCGILKSETEMNIESSFLHWNFVDIWSMDEKTNGGYPILQTPQSPLQLNIVNASMVYGETLQLTAYKNAAATNNITWTVSFGDATVNDAGLITACGTGFATITAMDGEGNKANCNIYMMDRNTSVSAEDFSLNIGNSAYHSVTFGNGSSGDYIVSATSSDSSIIQIERFLENDILISAIAPGTVTISFETAQGLTGTCTGTVTNYATSITINGGSSSLSVNRGESKQISCSTSPTGNTSTVTWTSENPEIATVDQNGNVTGVAIGNTTITATTSSGYSDSCKVYVYAPAESISFTETSILLVVGDTYQTTLVKNPVDATDSISYKSSSTSIATVNSSTGLITAKAAGTATITATASSGVKSQIKVTVVNEIVEAASITLNHNEKTLILGDDFTLTAEVNPSDTIDKTITFSSDDESVATVDENGNVKTVAEGTTIIRATAANGVSSICIVTVYGFTEVNETKYFDIYCLEDLVLFRDFVNKSADNATTNARLMVDLDLSSVCSESLGSFTPIGTPVIFYNGIFNGNGHTISNLYVSASTYTGLFGYLGENGKVTDLTLENVDVTGTTYVGGVAGKSEGIIENVSVSGNVSGTSYVGGIAGSNSGEIKYCGNATSLTATNLVGGIVGDSNNSASIANSYSAAIINTSDYRAGGICGMNSAAISNCYYDNTLYTGSAIGRGDSTSCADSGKSTDAFKNGEVTYLLNSDLSEIIFYQTLNDDVLPVLDNTHKQVYYGFINCGTASKIYTNSVTTDDRNPHNYVDGICSVCGAEESITFIDEDMHMEGLTYKSNYVEQLVFDMNLEGVHVEIYNIDGLLLEDNDLVGTGASVYIYDIQTNALLNTYTVVLYGDVNGDGLIDEEDQKVITKVATCQENIENKWFLMAADVNHDGAVDAFDAIETDLQNLDMHNIEQKNKTAYTVKNDAEEESLENVQ